MEKKEVFLRVRGVTVSCCFLCAAQRRWCRRACNGCCTCSSQNPRVRVMSGPPPSTRGSLCADPGTAQRRRSYCLAWWPHPGRRRIGGGWTRVCDHRGTATDRTEAARGSGTPTLTSGRRNHEALLCTE